MAERDDLLVGWLPTPGDLTYLERDRWYRIPYDADIAEEILESPPAWFAAFESKRISGIDQRIERYAKVLGCRVKTRLELLGADAPGPKHGRTYCQLLLGPVQMLERPLVTVANRSNVFIRTTLTKLLAANEFNDIFNDSPYEDDLWARLKSLGAAAQRQWLVPFLPGKNYVLDFALFCREGRLDVEIDGLQHHKVQANSESDSDRDANLGSKGWAVHRIRTTRWREDPDDCMNLLAETIEQNGGHKAARARLVPTARGPVRQMQLMRERTPYGPVNDHSMNGPTDHGC